MYRTLSSIKHWIKNIKTPRLGGLQPLHHGWVILYFSDLLNFKPMCIIDLEETILSKTEVGGSVNI